MNPNTLWAVAYRNVFPDRYMHPSLVDSGVAYHVSKLPEGSRVLDIGGGVHGTQALQHMGMHITSLDPYISGKPVWANEVIQWGTPDLHGTFKLVVLRGCINYLSYKEMQEAREFIAPGGALLANTFAVPPTLSIKPFTSPCGFTGIERAQYEPECRQVVHTLYFDNGYRTITHTFNYYDVTDYDKVFPGVRYIFYGTNSVILLVKKEEASVS